MTYQFKPAVYKYKGRPKDIDMVVIHFTAAGTLNGTVSWFQNAASKASAHYVIGRDGTVVQMVREGDRAWHAGRSSWDGVENCNEVSIGIELVNWGNLKTLDGLPRCWPDSWTRKYDSRLFGSPKKIGEWWWAPYPQVQLDACTKLVRELRTRYDIPEERILGHSNISPGRKLDPGPLYSMHGLKLSSRPEPLILPDEVYRDDPKPEDYATKELNRSGSMSLVERILELFRR